ncbi:ribbon-helix-helix protein, CopG family [Methylobacterium sp. WL18]|uniref:ribbon-helix-helix protein, CopG family n=1 Tax=Methylobacterium sp. WL18 TaxID=2603897 RepID=UPI0011C95BD5|nr:ribbon-helix-helix protein, CopG family [Methylobacterium sp. WL18]TXN76067.1 ribbon-helix-helix protein, CopG family [Methylobacterium sp. WL18]
MRPLNFDATITIRTDADLRRAIDAAARREGASASEWVRQALGAIVAPKDPPCSPTPVALAVILSLAA